MSPKTLGLMVLILVAAIMLRELFPKRQLVASPPRIQTVHDTVATVDTLWLRRQVKTDTLYLERFSVTPPETVRIAPRLMGITGLVVAPFLGDSTVVQGFTLVPTDSGYAVGQWQGQFYTTGPVRALAIVNHRPAISFGPPPPKGCRFFCTAKHYLTGALFGAAAWEVFR